MNIDKTTITTFNLLKELKKITILRTQQEFFDTINLDKLIIYLLVEWSGPERVSRHFIYQSLSDLDKNGTPVFQIDCSDQTKKYVVDWLIGQRVNQSEFYYGGYGETLLISQGLIIDFIKFPGKLGLEKTKEKIADWKYM